VTSEKRRLTLKFGQLFIRVWFLACFEFSALNNFALWRHR